MLKGGSNTLSDSHTPFPCEVLCSHHVPANCQTTEQHFSLSPAFQLRLTNSRLVFSASIYTRGALAGVAMAGVAMAGVAMAGVAMAGVAMTGVAMAVLTLVDMFLSCITSGSGC